MENLIALPVILEESNEVLTLLLNKETAARATQDEQFLRRLVNEHKESGVTQEDPVIDTEVTMTDETTTTESHSKSFIWPDEAVLLLIDLYREKEKEFKIRRHNLVWAEIAGEMKRSNYAVTGLQCSTKLAGLRRTYKNIYEQNKKSGNTHSSWAFYSAMDSLIGEKAYIQPPAEASSEGPIPSTSSSSSSLLVSEDLRSAPKKRRVEHILENYINDIKHERDQIKQQRDEERRIAKKEREDRYKERKVERERMHKENMEIQKSLLSILKTLANKK